MRDYLLDTLAHVAVAGLPIPDHCKSQLRKVLCSKVMSPKAYAKFFKPLPNEPEAVADLSWMVGWSKAESEVVYFIEAALKLGIK